MGARAHIGLAALLLLLFLTMTATASAQWAGRPALSTSATSVVIASTPSSATAAELAAPPADVGSRLLPRPRLLAPLSDILRQTANAAPPGNFPFQSVTSPDRLVTLHYYYRSAQSANNALSEVDGILRDPLQSRLGLTLKRNVDIWIYNSRSEFLAGANPTSPQITGAFTTFDGSSV